MNFDQEERTQSSLIKEETTESSWMRHLGGGSADFWGW